MATQQKQMTKEERLAALRAKAAAAVNPQKGYWRPKEGTHLIRILPPIGNMWGENGEPFFWQPVGKHYLPGKVSVTCPQDTTSGAEACPICELSSLLYRGGAEDKALAKKLRCKSSFYMNIILRKEGDKNFDTYEGPYIFTPGPMIFGDIESLLKNDQYGDISDPTDGVDLYLDRSGTGKEDTEYGIQARRGDYQPLHTDPAIAQEILDAAKDLSYVILPDDPNEDKAFLAQMEGETPVVLVKSYDRIVAETGISPDCDVDLINYEAGAEEPADERRPSRNGNSKSPVKADVAQRIRDRRSSR